MIKLLVLFVLTAVSYGSAAVGVPIQLSWTCSDSRVDGSAFDCATEVKVYTVYNAKTGEAVITTSETSITVTADTELDSTPAYYVKVTDLFNRESDPSNSDDCNLNAATAPVMTLKCFVVDGG